MSVDINTDNQQMLLGKKLSLQDNCFLESMS